MVRKRRVLFPILLLVAGGLLFLYRFPLLNWVQQRLLQDIAGRAIVDNGSFHGDSRFSHHLLYSLKGTQRLWPHRVNSVRRLRYLYAEFAGFECDIRFDSATHTLGIGHDQPEGEVFPSFLRTDEAGKKCFWLDLKNVDAGNAAVFGSTLERLDSEFAIKDRVILECYDTAAASRLSALGFLTALNISAAGPSAAGSPAAGSPAAGSSAAGSRAARSSAAEPSVAGLSVERALHPGLITADMELHDSVEARFPGSKQLNWDIAFRHSMDKDNLLRRANDTSLLVCLINVKSPGYR